MSKALCILFMGAGFFPAVGQAQEPPEYFRESRAESKSLHDLKLEITRVLPDGKIGVKFSNISKGPVRIWEEGNSWGAGPWRVLRVKGGQVETFFQELATGFTGNWPSFHEIRGGEHLERTLDLNGPAGYCAWHGLSGGKVRFDPGDMVIVVYDVPATSDARDLGRALPVKELKGVSVWFGVTTAYATVK